MKEIFELGKNLVKHKGGYIAQRHISPSCVFKIQIKEITKTTVVYKNLDTGGITRVLIEDFTKDYNLIEEIEEDDRK